MVNLRGKDRAGHYKPLCSVQGAMASWSWLRSCGSSEAHVRDVEVRQDCIDHAEHERSHGVVLSTQHEPPCWNSLFSRSSASGHREAESTGQTLAGCLNTMFCRSKELSGCMSWKQHVFKQLNCMTKGEIVTLAAHTFPLLEETQISLLGSFAQDEGLTPSCGCQTHGSSLPTSVWLQGWTVWLPFGGELCGSRMLSKARPQKHHENNILSFISLLPISEGGGCVFRVGRKGHWGEHYSSGFLKDLLDNSTNSSSLHKGTMGSCWAWVLGSAKKHFILFFYRRLLNCLVALHNCFFSTWLNYTTVKED